MDPITGRSARRMNRMIALLALAAMLAMPVSASYGSGVPAFEQVDAPDGLPDVEGAGEPTIGIPWDTDHIFYQAYASTYRISADGDTLTWEDVTSPNAQPFNLDPMLHADPISGRIWAGGLFTACSVMEFSDDDGATWSTAANMCGVYGVDHQTIGSGPWSGATPSDALYDRATYYCAHGEALSGPGTGQVFSAVSPTACVTSLDGGLTWGAPVPWAGGCGSLHGHVRVSPVTGFAAVPDADCADGVGGFSDLAGFAYSDDNGLSWLSRTVAGSTAYSPFDNPSMAFGHDEGWLWYGQGGDDGAFIALSKDEGVSWETLGEDNGTTWFNVGALHDPPIVEATFPDVMVGDDDRVAFSFIGLEDLDGDGLSEEYPDNNVCGENDDNRHWHYYVATSYDAGANWTVTKATEDPVQIGGVFQGQEATPNCRNLLDFNDMDIDSTGRIYIAFADGCIQACATNMTRDAEGAQAARAALLRQTDGRGLFAAFDGPAVDTDGDGIPDHDDDDIDGDGIPNSEDEDPMTADGGTSPGESTPGVGLMVIIGALGAVALRRRQ